MKVFEFSEASVSPEWWLCLKVDNVPMARQFVLDSRGKKYDCEIKEHRGLRSLTANGYMWKLCELLAKAIGSTKDEVYIDAVRDVGIFRDFHLPEDEVKSLRTAWSAIGTGWPTEQVDYTPDGLVVIRAYYGSSVYSTKRMARLIDNLVQDCKAVGIETLPPDKLAALVDQHKPVKIGGGDG